jgi:hypothetical protein
MDFYDVVGHVLELLQRQGRVSQVLRSHLCRILTPSSHTRAKDHCALGGRRLAVASALPLGAVNLQSLGMWRSGYSTPRPHYLEMGFHDECHRKRLCGEQLPTSRSAIGAI